MSNWICHILCNRFTQWRSQYRGKGGRVPPWQEKKSKIRKKRKIGKKRGKIGEKLRTRGKIGKVLSLCPSWQIGLATLLGSLWAPLFLFLEKHLKFGRKKKIAQHLAFLPNASETNLFYCFRPTPFVWQMCLWRLKLPRLSEKS